MPARGQDALRYTGLRKVQPPTRGPRSPRFSLLSSQTVGDAKVAFQQAYGRPVGGVQQGFVAELLTSSVVAMVSPSYLPSRVTSVGFEALCKEFLTGAVSDEEREKLRTSLIYGLGQDASSVSREATEMAVCHTPLSSPPE